MSSLPWLLVAVPHEHRAFERRTVETLRRRPTAAWRCAIGDKPFLLAETGVGGAVTRQTLDWLFTLQPPSFVFLTGFAGALDETLKVADAIRADVVIDPGGRRYVATFPTDQTCPTGALLTTDRFLGTPADKRRLAAAHQAIAVDMETSSVAAWCDRRNVPWGCVRVISDDVHTPISNDVFGLLENGHVSPWRLTKAIVRRPTIVRELLQLQHATSKAADVIAATLRAVLASVEP